MDAEAKPIAKKILELINVLKPAPVTSFAQRLHFKAYCSLRATEFRDDKTLDKGSPWPDNDPSPSSANLANFSRATQLSQLAHASVARAIKDTDNQFKDKLDFVCSPTKEREKGGNWY
jgi:hypothetical protein